MRGAQRQRCNRAPLLCPKSCAPEDARQSLSFGGGVGQAGGSPVRRRTFLLDAPFVTPACT